MLTNKDMVPISELQHLMAKLASEASELSHAVLKGIEFGIDHPYPDGKTILQKIEEEYNDVLGVVKMLNELGFLINARDDLIKAKVTKVTDYMGVAQAHGVLVADTVNIASEPIVSTPRYQVGQNTCNCHPDTCCCDDYAIYDTKNGYLKHSTHFSETVAQEITDALNK